MKIHSGHGTGNDSIAKKWKEELGLRTYFNFPHSPDLSIIENCWQITKQVVGRQEHWTDEETIGAIKAGWDRVSQEYINKQVLTMMERMDDVLDREGKMTKW